MVAYEFYWRDPTGNTRLIGILPERRMNTERITQESILRWGGEIFDKITNIKDIFFVQVTVDENMNRISRPTPAIMTKK